MCAARSAGANAAPIATTMNNTETPMKATGSVVAGSKYAAHTSATDPVAFIGVSVLFIVVAMGAAFAPALRAAHIDPLRALRYE